MLSGEQGAQDDELEGSQRW